MKKNLLKKGLVLSATILSLVSLNACSSSKKSEVSKETATSKNDTSKIEESTQEIAAKEDSNQTKADTQDLKGSQFDLGLDNSTLPKEVIDSANEVAQSYKDYYDKLQGFIDNPSSITSSDEMYILTGQQDINRAKIKFEKLTSDKGIDQTNSDYMAIHEKLIDFNLKIMDQIAKLPSKK
ncbi:hypothetical protein [Floricoccus penangensis]|uniref:hypothetical protein n=1 Tax=Floricoccus penangensis TaxID=1859475 RepID=UPI002041F309|nr:hypothetical protein [Floricoccus penangensis]URZ88188.1 hypothetical protein KIW23_03895 [Floricoccus penangensis]